MFAFSVSLSDSKKLKQSPTSDGFGVVFLLYTFHSALQVEWHQVHVDTKNVHFSKPFYTSHAYVLRPGT